MPTDKELGHLLQLLAFDARQVSRAWRFLPLSVGLAVLASAGLVAASEPSALPAAEQRLSISFSLAIPADLETAWTLEARPRNEGQEPVQHPPRQPVLHEIQGVQPTELTLPAGGTWELGGDLPGFWVKGLTVDTASPSREPIALQMELWPLGTLAGRLLPSKSGKPIPNELAARTLQTPSVLGRPPSPPGIRRCPVAQDGTWSCSLPAGRLDLELVVEGFVPIYLWGLEVAPQATTTLPPSRLRQGSSLAAWVVIEGGKIDPEHCVARLTPSACCGKELRRALRDTAKAVETKVNPDGFLQLTQLVPGYYTLEVSQPGFATARVDRIEVITGRETFVPEPVTLAPPLSLTLEITPPLAPGDRPWSVRVTSSAASAANAGRPTTAFEGPADGEGRVQVEGLPPGTVSVGVFDGDGNRWFNNTFSPWPLETSRTQRIELDRVALTGRLLLGDAPLPAQLEFGSRTDPERIRFSSDDEGRFTGLLPRGGMWGVRVRNPESGLDSMTQVDVRPSDSGQARLEVKLPDNRLFGRVTDSRGQPVNRAVVLVQGASTALVHHRTTDGQGRFELRGLAAGTLSVTAEHAESDCQAGPLTSRLAEEGTLGPLELQCRAMKQVTGRVHAAEGPARAVRLTLQGLPPAQGSGQTVTAKDGTFDLTVPADLSLATVYLQGAGYGLQQQRVDLGREEPLYLELEAGAGDLELVLDHSDDLRRNNQFVVLFQAEGLVPLALTRASRLPASEDEPRRLLLHSLAPGRYTACLAEAPDVPGAPPTEQELLTCDSGHLAEGERLRLHPVRAASP